MKAKLVAESLRSFIKENAGSITPEELEMQLRNIIDKGLSAVETYKQCMALINKYPELNSGLGETREYQEAVQPYIDWSLRISDMEEQEINDYIRSQNI